MDAPSAARGNGIGVRQDTAARAGANMASASHEQAAVPSWPDVLTHAVGQCETLQARLERILRVNAPEKLSVLANDSHAELRQYLYSVCVSNLRPTEIHAPRNTAHASVSVHHIRSIKPLIMEAIRFSLECGRGSNVLALGFRKILYDEASASVHGMPGIQNTYPNTIVTYLSSAKWQRILELVGPKQLFELLTETALFVRLERNCLMQICGRPLNDILPMTVSLKRKSRPSLKKRKSASTRHDGPGPKRRKRAKKAKTPRTDGVMPAADDVQGSHRQQNGHNDLSAADNAPSTPVASNSVDQIHISSSQRQPSFEVNALLYSSPRMRLPANNVLVKLPASRQGASKLLQHVFNVQADGKGRIPKRYRSVHKLMSATLHRAKKLNIRRIAERCTEHRPGVQSNLPVHDVSLLSAAAKPLLQSDEAAGYVTQSDSSDDERECEGKRRYCTKRNGHGPHQGSTQTSLTHEELLKQHTPTRKVQAFVCCCLKKLLPLELLGGHQNRKLLFKAVGTFLSLTRFSRLRLDAVIRGLRLNDFKWTRLGVTRGDQKLRMEMLKHFITWLFRDVVCQLVRSAFYVTETGMHRQRLFFFPAKVWFKLADLARASQRMLETFQPLSPQAAAQVLASRKLCFARLRLLPKSSSMRLILNMKSCASKAEIDRLRKALLSKLQEQSGNAAVARLMASLGTSANRQLSGLFHVLRHEKRRHHQKLGASVLGVDEIHTRYRPFVQRIRGAATDSMGSQPFITSAPVPLYIVSVDVKDCFDSINQEKLLDIIRPLLTDDEYTIRKTVALLLNSRGLYTRYVSKVCPSDEDDPREVHFSRRAARMSKEEYHSAILIDRVVHHHENRAGLTKLLEELVGRNLVVSGSQCLKQKRGIAQGSVLSTLLCSFFYGDLERRCLSPQVFDPAKALLLRMVDDFLLVTTCRDTALSFLKTMHAGLEDYGCNINQSKTRTNFDPNLPQGCVAVGDSLRVGSQARVDVEQKDCSPPRRLRATGVTATQTTGSTSVLDTSTSSGVSTASHSFSQDAPWFQWCGLLVNTRTLETRIDFTRYYGAYLADTLSYTVGDGSPEGLETRILRHMSIKHNKLLFDPYINTPFNVIFNLYQLAYLGALKYHVVVTKSITKKDREAQRQTHDAILIRCMRATFNKLGGLCSKAGFELPVSEDEYVYLTALAFRRALRRFKPSHSATLKTLVTLQRGCKVRPKRERLIETVADSPHHAEFDSILCST